MTLTRVQIQTMLPTLYNFVNINWKKLLNNEPTNPKNADSAIIVASMGFFENMIYFQRLMKLVWDLRKFFRFIFCSLFYILFALFTINPVIFQLLYN